MMPELELAGKVVIVTGAGRGIGKAIALAYAVAGASVSCSARTLEQIEQTVQEIENRGGRGLAVQADVTNQESVHQMTKKTVDEFGGLDILVVNAGANLDRKTVEESDPANWLATLEVNLLGAYYSVKMAIPYLRERGAGKIIIIGSGTGHRSNNTSSAYACSKAGLWMLTRVLAEELEQFNISVNELIPGPVKTGMTQQEDPVFQIDSEWTKAPEDVIPLALFLATQPDRGPTAQSFSLMRRDA